MTDSRMLPTNRVDLDVEVPIPGITAKRPQ